MVAISLTACGLCCFVKVQEEVKAAFQDFLPGKASGRNFKREASKTWNMTWYLHRFASVFITVTGQRHQVPLCSFTTAKSLRSWIISLKGKDQDQKANSLGSSVEMAFWQNDPCQNMTPRRLRSKLYLHVTVSKKQFLQSLLCCCDHTRVLIKYNNRV